VATVSSVSWPLFPALLISWDAIAAIAGVLALFVAVMQWWIARQPAATSEDLARECDYLLELLSYLERYQPAPLRPRRDEHIAAAAEIRPSFSILSVKDRLTPRARGKTTQNLVGKLLSAATPYVVLGEPGSGKSVALRRVAAEIARRGQKARVPRLPVYVRLGSFTAPPDEANGFPEYVRQTVRASGPAGARVAELFAQYRQQGRFIFILDGLDEMPRQDYSARFAAVVADVLEFSGNNVYVLACRSYDFRESFPATLATIQPFGGWQIEEFLKGSLGVAKGKRTAAAIRRLGGAARDMAPNPFFLKLLAEYVRAGDGSLPKSRADVMQAFEELLLRGAEPILTGDAKLVLARLAFLITAESRGVTLMEDELMARFAEAFDAGQIPRERLEAAMQAAVERNVLIAEPGTASGRVLCFSHHRLQEYYAAQYLHRFGPALDWRRAFDNIWWRETIIMLCGIAPDTGEVIAPVLERVPEQPLLFPALAGAVSAAIDALRGHGPVAEAAQRARELDPTGAYGLPAFPEGEDVRGPLRTWLASVFGAETRLPDPASLRRETAEPNADADADALRRWLEPRQQYVLDAAELAVDCLRNSRAGAGVDLAGVARAIAAVAADGNDGEKVRAIEILARIPDYPELYEALRPALTGASAWPRRDAMFALMESHVGFRAKQEDLPFLLYLQFLKGETLQVLPKYARACRASPRLLRLAPQIAVLALWSAAGALSPTTIPLLPVLLYRAAVHWLWIPAAPLAAYLYHRKLKYSQPMVAGALLLACLTAIPAVAGATYSGVLGAMGKSAGTVATWAAVAASAALVFIPVLLVNGVILLAAMLAVLASASTGPMRAWALYWRENWKLNPFQFIILVLAGIGVICLICVGFAALVGVGMGLVGQGIFWAVDHFAVARYAAIAVGVLAMLAIFWGLRRKVAKTLRHPAEAGRMALAGIVKALVGIAKAVAIYLAIVGVLMGGALIVLLAVGGYQATAPVVQAHASGIWLALVAIVVAACAALLVRPWIGTVLPRKEEDDYARLTPAERLEFDRQMISRSTSQWERYYYHRRILRSYKAMRQDRAGISGTTERA
jgi:hypothetical protein